LRSAQDHGGNRGIDAAYLIHDAVRSECDALAMPTTPLKATKLPVPDASREKRRPGIQHDFPTPSHLTSLIIQRWQLLAAWLMVCRSHSCSSVGILMNQRFIAQPSFERMADWKTM